MAGSLCRQSVVRHKIYVLILSIANVKSHAEETSNVQDQNYNAQLYVPVPVATRISLSLSDYEK